MTATVNRLGIASIRTASVGSSATVWRTVIDATWDALEANLAKTVTGNPNGLATPRWTGQPIYDPSAALAYVGRSTGTATTRWAALAYATQVEADIETAAAAAGAPIGSIWMWPGDPATATPPTGYLFLNGDSIGSAASAADQADDDYEALYLVLWANLPDAAAPVAGGRGATAAADWAANKAMTLPDGRNSGQVGAGSSFGIGLASGSWTRTMTATQMPSHTHSASGLTTNTTGAHQHSGGVDSGASFGGSGFGSGQTGSAGNHSHTISGTLGNTGGGSPFSVLGKWIALAFIIRYA